MNRGLLQLQSWESQCKHAASLQQILTGQEQICFSQEQPPLGVREQNRDYWGRRKAVGGQTRPRRGWYLPGQFRSEANHPLLASPAFHLAARMDSTNFTGADLSNHMEVAAV